ncbi:MAG TPA: GNAT family N-acetyltransferase [Chloroflexota bacterium]|jgi:ribosomal protein S18 acetylase RimI-like enzyme|nr:GNAT family N-acetyltransferase [Chloroflexota bacterium]
MTASTIVVEPVTSVSPELVEALGGLLPQLHPTLPLPTAAVLEEVLRCEATTLLVAREGAQGPVIGTACVVVYRTPSRQHARLENVIVDHSARGQGVGAALTSEAVRRARDAGCSVIELNTNPRREAANRLYQRLRFERHHTNNYWIKF